jgi:hypothetical protein
MRINTETMSVTPDQSTTRYKFKPGEMFKLAPTARVQWIAISNQDMGCIKAVRASSDYGKRVLVWMEAGMPDNEERQALRRDLGWSNPTTFYAHNLETAELIEAIGTVLQPYTNEQGKPDLKPVGLDRKGANH